MFMALTYFQTHSFISFLLVSESQVSAFFRCDNPLPILEQHQLLAFALVPGKPFS